MCGHYLILNHAINSIVRHDVLTQYNAAVLKKSKKNLSNGSWTGMIRVFFKYIFGCFNHLVILCFDSDVRPDSTAFQIVFFPSNYPFNFSSVKPLPLMFLFSVLLF